MIKRLPSKISYKVGTANISTYQSVNHSNHVVSSNFANLIEDDLKYKDSIFDSVMFQTELKDCVSWRIKKIRKSKQKSKNKLHGKSK